jgi:hypothetical protein
MLTVLMLYKLIRKWFGQVTSLLSISIFLTADWFLFIARSGTGTIELSFWFTVLIFSLMKFIERKPNWLIFYALASGLILFSPFGLYISATTAVCTLVCAMFRKRAKEASLIIKVASLLFVVICLGLVAYLSVKDISYLRSLTGTAQVPSLFEYFKNLILNSSSSVMLWPDNNPLVGPSGVFIIRYFEFIFILFGLIMFVVTRVNRLNVVVIANSVVLALAGGLNYGLRGSGLLIVPSVLFMTAGIRHFIHRWQKVFPKNPYAKIALYIPLAIVIITATTLHFQSYFVLWPGQTATKTAYSEDFSLLKKEVSKPGKCVINNAPDEYGKLLNIKKPICGVSFTEGSIDLTVNDNSRIISKQRLKIANSETKALTSSNTKNNVRWFVYQL